MPIETFGVLAVLMALAGCAAAPPVQTLTVDPLGHFEFRAPNLAMKGVVIGAPHGSLVPGAASMARSISDRTGAGFVAGYGFTKALSELVKQAISELVKQAPGKLSN